jgi:chemotaxis protein methyltransferase CheR
MRVPTPSGKLARVFTVNVAFRHLPEDLRLKYFSPEGGQWRVDPDLAKHVRWVSANLINEEEVGQLAVADIIFCRNVFIYFSSDAVRKTVDLFARKMRSPGYLFVAASESLLRLTTDFELEEAGGAFVYVKQ